MPKLSAGILMFRKRNSILEVLLVHPGGPYWAGKDLGAWSIPKGEFGPNEDPLDAARREFREETGVELPGRFVKLQPIRQKSGKIVHAWAVEGEFDVEQLRSNTFPLEWPPRSGRTVEVPEVDKAAWFDIETALEKIVPGQSSLLTQLLDRLM